MPDNIEFVVLGNGSFAPRFYPETIRVSKQQNLNREESFCGAENVSNNGSKNRDVHIAGRLVGEAEKRAFERVIEDRGTLVVSSTTWSGEAYIKEGELEGPVAIDGQTDAFHWQYTLDLVSTGPDESSDGSGIIQRSVDSGGGGVSGPEPEQ